VLPLETAKAYRDQLFGGGFRLYLQPIVDLASGRCHKVEALARLEMPDGTTVPPGVFLPLLGQAELDRLFRMALTQALQHLNYLAAKHVWLEVSVNLPAASLLEEHMVTVVQQALQQNQVAPARLTLELLETERITEPTQEGALAGLLRAGVRLAMDDLGSGYSSLKRLSTLPFHAIKLDKDLLIRLKTEPVQAMALITSVIEMGRALNQEVVIEGLEDVGVIETAAILGAPFGQGFGLGRPMPPDRLPEWLASFVLPIQAGCMQTYLGALAYHWHRTRSGLSHDGASLADCPLTAFLNAHASLESAAQSAHRTLHHNPADLSARRLLLDWLIHQVIGESKTAATPIHQPF
jgi:EAL domain-containing protein (putative c-di-GMP-specific phosphodiesterase class I)